MFTQAGYSLQLIGLWPRLLWSMSDFYHFADGR